MNVVPVLVYHHVSPDREVTPGAFEAHLRWLADHGRATLTLAALAAHISGKKEAPAGSVLITFDDAYADQWVYAHPLLKEHGMTAVLFVPTAFPTMSSLKRLTSVDGGAIADSHSLERGLDGFLSWGEIRAMADSGLWEVGSHSHTHRCFDKQKSFSGFEDEMIVSRQIIESRTGHPCTAFCWPWGEVVSEWAGRLPSCGYRLAFTKKEVPIEPGADPFGLGRTKVRQAQIAAFERLLRPEASPAPAGPRSTGRTAGQTFGKPRGRKARRTVRTVKA